MKKLCLMLTAFVAVSAMALAENLWWYVPYGMYTHDSTDLVTEDSGAILDDYSVLWQLIYAGPNNAIDEIDLLNSANGYVGGDDKVLDFRLLSSGNSGIFDNYLYTEDTDSARSFLEYTYNPDSPTDYYVYQRIYEAQTPQEGTYYFESEMLKLADDYKTGNLAFTLGPEESGIQANHQVPMTQPSIPEPATMSLLGLGALVLGLRRKLRK